MWYERFKGAAAVTLLSAIVSLTGCGGGGGGSSAAPSAAAPDASGTADEGKLIIGITDAPGDFVTYEVTATALTLTRANGDVVDTLPLFTRIDFVELAEVTELLTIATVPAGNYTSATLTLDFEDAVVLVQDENGDAVTAELQDTNGDPLGEVPMAIELTTRDEIVIRRGIPAAFSLDFDLAASNSIELTDPPVVTVEPFLLATPELEADRTHRARGLLADVQTGEDTFTLAVRPFRLRNGAFGELTVAVTDDTVYEIDGEPFTGAEGLEVLATLTGDEIPVIAGGSVVDTAFTASTVLAGSSVPWSEGSVVKGVVTAREGDALTLRGVSIELEDGVRRFRGTLTVLVDADTAVTALGAEALTSRDISVGQRVTLWGETVDDTTVDADRVRLVMSQLTGEVVQADPLAVDLFWLNSRRPAIYDFTGTGVTAEDDADPDFYEIDTTTLGLATVEDGDLVRVRGLVNAFGAAPADYLARTVIDVQTERRAGMVKVQWPAGTTRPFVSTAPDSLVLDLAEARKVLKLRGVPAAFFDDLEELTLAAPESGNGVYAVTVRGTGSTTVFRGFDAMVEDVIAKLDEGLELRRSTAHGGYNGTSMTLTTARASFVFSNPASID